MSLHKKRSIRGKNGAECTKKREEERTKQENDGFTPGIQSSLLFFFFSCDGILLLLRKESIREDDG